MKFSITTLAPLFLAAYSSAFSGISQGVVSKTAGWNIEEISPIQRVEGETRHAFGFGDNTRDTVQVAMESPMSRPMTSEVNLWLGPDYTPFQLKCHSEDGKEFPIQTLVGTKKYTCNVEVKNVGAYTQSFDTACSYAVEPLSDCPNEIKFGESKYIEGGAIYKHSFGAEVEQLHVMLATKGKHLKAKIELLQGPNNIKQEYEVYASNGEKNPLFVVFETKGAPYSVRIKNLASMEYPLDFYYRPSKIVEPEFSPSRATADWNSAPF